MNKVETDKKKILTDTWLFTDTFRTKISTAVDFSQFLVANKVLDSSKCMFHPTWIIDISLYKIARRKAIGIIFTFASTDRSLMEIVHFVL